MRLSWRINPLKTFRSIVDVLDCDIQPVPRKWYLLLHVTKHIRMIRMTLILSMINKCHS